MICVCWKVSGSIPSHRYISELVSCPCVAVCGYVSSVVSLIVVYVVLVCCVSYCGGSLCGPDLLEGGEVGVSLLSNNFRGGEEELDYSGLLALGLVRFYG
jgi:hypothetical protein